jgi:hypothetical protein
MQLTELILFDFRVNFERYMGQIFYSFLRWLTQEKGRYTFQHDFTTANTARASMNALREMYGDRIIIGGLHLACSPGLSPSDSYLWGILKQNLYRENPHTIEEMKENI